MRWVEMGYGAFLRVRNAGLALAVTIGGAWAEPVTIAALGDSLTQGYGLYQEDGLTSRLEEWLRAAGEDVVVVNAGVSGDTTAGGLSRVGWTLTDDVDALIVALGGNDLLRAIPPETSRANLEGILQAAAAKGLPVMLVGLEAPGNYGPEFKQAFDSMYPDLAAEYGAIHVKSFFDGVLEVGMPREELRRLMQADGIHPTAEGVKLMVENLGPKVLELVARAKD